MPKRRSTKLSAFDTSSRHKNNCSAKREKSAIAGRGNGKNSTSILVQVIQCSSCPLRLVGGLLSVVSSTAQRSRLFGLNMVKDAHCAVSRSPHRHFSVTRYGDPRHEMFSAEHTVYPEKNTQSREATGEISGVIWSRSVNVDR